MGKFDLFNKFNSAVVILNDKKETIFRNNVFKRCFTDFENIKKFSHKLYYEVCALESNDVTVHSPILQAMKSGEDFCAHVIYQSTSNEYFYYDMNVTHKGKYSVIIFTDVTAKVNLENVSRKNQGYAKKLAALEEENRNLSKIKLQAQSHAMKLLLLNNISNIVELN